MNAPRMSMPAGRSIQRFGVRRAVRLVGALFFFSSRRRHTRLDCDWSSDVCSSDLAGQLALTTPPSATAQSGAPFAQQPAVQVQDANGNPVATQGVSVTASIATGPAGASLASFSATSDATGLARFAALTLSGPPRR